MHHYKGLRGLRNRHGALRTCSRSMEATEGFSGSSVYRVPGCRRKIFSRVLVYRSALNGSIPGTEENPLCGIRCRSWLASAITGSVQALETHQRRALAVCGPSLGLPPGRGSAWGGSAFRSIQWRRVREKDRHMEVYQPQRASLGVPDVCPRPPEEAPSLWRCLQAWGPRWASAPLVLVFQQAWKGGDCEGNRTSSFPALSPKTKLSYKRLAKPGGATSKHH